MQRGRPTLIAWIAGALLAPSAGAHPFHLSDAEVELNERTRSLEVAMRVFPDDLEAALQAGSDLHMDLERTEEIDARIAEYLRQTFVLRRADGSVAELRWVGKEIDVKDAWLYFEILDVGSLEDATLTNSVLLEQNPLQHNTVRIRVGRRTFWRNFDRSAPKQTLLGSNGGGIDLVDIEQGYARLQALLGDAPNIDPSDRMALEIAGSMISRVLLAGRRADESADAGAALDAMAEALRSAPDDGPDPAALIRAAALAAQAGEARSAFTLLGEAVTIADARGSSERIVSSVLRAAADLAHREGDSERAARFALASENGRDEQLVALGEARLYVLGHRRGDEDEHDE